MVECPGLRAGMHRSYRNCHGSSRSLPAEQFHHPAMSAVGEAGVSQAGAGRLRRTSPALLDHCGIRVVGLVKSAITRASTAARSASASFIPTTRTTARASNSTRSAENASQSASQGITTPCFPERYSVCSVPVPATLRRQGHPWPLPAVFCAASCREPVSANCDIE
jgi:hypothetical protein